MLLFALLSCTDSADSGDQDGCSIEELAGDLAGQDATDCGSVGIDEDRTKIDACVVAAFEKGTPFYAVYVEQGIDSQVSNAVASDGANVWTLDYDSDPSGGGDVGAVVYQSTCVDPTVKDKKAEPGHERLSCSAPGTSTKICDEGD